MFVNEYTNSNGELLTNKYELLKQVLLLCWILLYSMDNFNIKLRENYIADRKKVTRGACSQCEECFGFERTSKTLEMDEKKKV